MGLYKFCIIIIIKCHVSSNHSGGTGITSQFNVIQDNIALQDTQYTCHTFWTENTGQL